VGGPAPLVGAIHRTRDVHHGSDVVHTDAIRVQGGVDAVGDMLWRPTPPEIVTDEVSRADERVLMAVGPREARATQLIEVSVIPGIGSRNRSAGNQGGAGDHRDGKSGQPASWGHRCTSFILGVDDAVIVRAQSGKHVYNSEIWEKAFCERLEQRTTALDAARASAPPG
jgi:hypothetical protein